MAPVESVGVEPSRIPYRFESTVRTLYFGPASNAELAQSNRFTAPSTRDCNNSEIPGHRTRLALCPAHSASRSALPAFCAARATFRMRDLGNGYGNISVPGLFSVCSKSLSIPRASLPVKPCVSAVRPALPLNGLAMQDVRARLLAGEKGRAHLYAFGS